MVYSYAPDLYNVAMKIVNKTTHKDLINYITMVYLLQPITDKTHKLPLMQKEMVVDLTLDYKLHFPSSPLP